MYRGTTPTIYIKSNVDLTGWTVEVDVKCPGALSAIAKTGDDVTITPTNGGCQVSTTLTQAETLSLDGEVVKVQIRAINSGIAIASSIVDIPLGDILRDGTIGGS